MSHQMIKSLGKLEMMLHSFKGDKNLPLHMLQESAPKDDAVFTSVTTSAQPKKSMWKTKECEEKAILLPPHMVNQRVLGYAKIK